MLAFNVAQLITSEPAGPAGGGDIDEGGDPGTGLGGAGTEDDGDGGIDMSGGGGGDSDDRSEGDDGDEQENLQTPQPREGGEGGKGKRVKKGKGKGKHMAGTKGVTAAQTSKRRKYNSTGVLLPAGSTEGLAGCM